MKIGILTFHSVYNFGANLQVHSTVEFLKKNGIESIIINWVPVDLENRYTKTIPAQQARIHKDFIRLNLPCTELCRTDLEISQVIERHGIQGVIIGSDAVLQHSTFLSRLYLTKRGILIKKKPESSSLYPNPFWGSFISHLKERIPVVIMSASSQNTNYKYIRGRLRMRVYASLKLFSFISVRDNWTRKMIKYLSYNKMNPTVTPDPVFAFNESIYEQASKKDIMEKFNLSDKYILLSFRNQFAVSKDWLKSFQLHAEKHDLECVALTMPNGVIFEHPFSKTIDTPLSPKEWYELIKYSSGYIGENMHPIVIALHNAIPFYSFDSYGIVRYRYFVNEKSSKVYDIIEKSGFPDNRISLMGKGYKCPKPEYILSKIVGFDRERCKHFSHRQIDEYEKMMNNIISILKQ